VVGVAGEYLLIIEVVAANSLSRRSLRPGRARSAGTAVRSSGAARRPWGTPADRPDNRRDRGRM